MIWTSAFELLSLLLLAGALLYLRKAARAMSEVRAAQELSKQESRARAHARAEEVQRRWAQLLLDLESSWNLSGYISKEMRSLSLETQRNLGGYGTWYREPSYAEDREVRSPSEVLSLTRARYHLPSLLRLLAHDVHRLGSEMRYIEQEAHELKIPLKELPHHFAEQLPHLMPQEVLESLQKGTRSMMEALPHEESGWRRLEQMLVAKLERPSASADGHTATAPRPRHPVLFQTYWPRRVRPEEWQTLLVYLAGGPEGLAGAEEDRRRRLRAPLGAYASSVSVARRPMPPGTLVTVVPELPSFRFNPPSATILWLEDWHCIEIRMQALPEAVRGKTFAGRVSFFIWPLLIGENDLEVEVLDPDTAGLAPQEEEARIPYMGRSLAEAYRSIFVSYSRKDAEIVDRLQAAYRALGDTYFRDTETLRSGETWGPELLAKIHEADIFQLCWSEYARASSFVEQEWRHALSVEKHRFIRPMFWKKPLPAPPSELAHLQFTYVEMEP